MTSTTRTTAVGYRFHPTDEELVNHYLRLKMLGRDSLVRDIAEVDVCKSEPWELPPLSAIKSNDLEWFFFCRRDYKYSNSHRTNRATKSGYWKATGKDRNVKGRGSNTVIATKKTLVFYTGRVPNGVRTDWVMHEYRPVANDPHQRPFVVCRLKKKTNENTNVSTCDEGEASSYTASDFEIPVLDEEVYNQPEANLESHFQVTLQPEEYDFSLSLQFPEYNPQGSSFLDTTVANSHNEELNWIQYLSDANEENEFVNSLLVDQDEYSFEENIHYSDSRAPESLRKVYFPDGGLSSDTDTDTTQTRYETFLGTSTLFNEQVGPKEYRQMHMVKTPHGSASSSSPSRVQHREGRNNFLQNGSLRLDASSHRESADISRQICINMVRLESPPKARTFTPQYQRRSRQSQRNSLRKAVSQDKAKDASRNNTIVDLTQKEKSITDSDKAQKMAQETTAKKSSKSTNQKGYFSFPETSLPCHDSSPPSVYFVNAVLGIVLFVVVIRELVSVIWELVLNFN